MEKISKKGILKIFFKAAITTIAIYIVIGKIDFQETKKILFSADLTWLIIALVIYNISKIISSIRFGKIFESIELKLSTLHNIKLYYVGMFYNLFLPGGIGGDGYKVYLLNRYFNKPVKLLIAGTLLDRISGMTALVFMAFVMSLLIDISFAHEWIYIILILLTLLLYPVYYLVVMLLFRSFIRVFHQTNLLSVAVQGFQLLCAFFIFRSLSIESMYLEYLILFLVSSVVVVIPFTIGGVGARELVFVFGANYLLIDKNTAVAFSLLFFLLNALSSLSGAFMEAGINKKQVNMG